MARDRNEYRLAGLLMVYPMLDNRTGSPTSSADNPTTGTLSWSREANRFCWECLQGAYALDDDQAALFSPALADDLTGLPPSFMSVGALDLFLEEDVAFALRLSKSGVPVELHVYPGVHTCSINIRAVRPTSSNRTSPAPSPACAQTRARCSR